VRFITPRRISMLRFMATLVTTAVLATSMPGAAYGSGIEEPLLLVASARLEGSPFEQTVVVAAPFRNGGHIGFIVNRRTTVRLDALFPDDAAAHNVTEPVYLGGPVMPRALFAVTRNVPNGSESVVPLMPGVYAVLAGGDVDRLMEATPNAARYFMGLVVWEPDQLEDQIRNGFWQARPADPQMVLPEQSTGLWNALRRPMALNVDGAVRPLG
jgi:putative AlgH/UPF0301 family transcriptional regulator